MFLRAQPILFFAFVTSVASIAFLASFVHADPPTTALPKVVVIRGSVTVLTQLGLPLLTAIRGTVLSSSDGLDAALVRKLAAEGVRAVVTPGSTSSKDCKDAIVTLTAESGNFLFAPDRRDRPAQLLAFTCQD